MSVSVYMAGRNYDGTSYSPLYYSDAAQNNGQTRFLVPSGKLLTVPLSTTSTFKATNCSSNSIPVYAFTNLYAIIEEETNRVIVTVQNTPDNRFIPLFIGESYTSSAMALYFSSSASTLEPATRVMYASDVDSGGYLTVKTQAASICAASNAISGVPIVSDGVVYLVPQGKEASFYTTVVSGPSIYFIVSYSDYQSLTSDLKLVIAELVNGTTITSYINTVFGVVPSPIHAISTTPSPTTQNPNYISPTQAAVIKKRAKIISTWFVFGFYIFLAFLAILIIIIFLLTIKSYPKKPLLYNQKTKTLTNLFR